MSRPAALFVCIGLAIIPAAGRADDVEKALEAQKKAREVYAKRHAQAVAQLLAGIDKKMQQATKAGEPGIALALQAEQQFVKSTKRRPLSPYLSAEAAQYERNLAGPKKELAVVYTKAVSVLTKASHLVRADELQKELQALLWAEDLRLNWVHAKGYFQRQADGTWFESVPDGSSWIFKEVNRQTECGELYEATRECWIRLQLSNCLIRYGQGQWKPLYRGE
jgi:hypothetical protein